MKTDEIPFTLVRMIKIKNTEPNNINKFMQEFKLSQAFGGN